MKVLWLMVRMDGKIQKYNASLAITGNFYILITSLIGGFQVFVEVQVMTLNGGIGYSAATIVYYMYQKAFEGFQLGYASSIAVILAIIIFIITIVNFTFQDKWVKTMD